MYNFTDRVVRHWSHLVLSVDNCSVKYACDIHKSSHSEFGWRGVLQFFLRPLFLSLLNCCSSPCVSVLVPDLLLHLCICESLQQGAPLVCVARVSDGNLHSGQWVFTDKSQDTQFRDWSVVVRYGPGQFILSRGVRMKSPKCSILVIPL